MAIIPLTLMGNSFQAMITGLLIVVCGLSVAHSSWAAATSAPMAAQTVSNPASAALTPVQQQALADMEQRTLGAATPNIPAPERFSRLESLVFGQTFPTDVLDTRLGRLKMALPKPVMTTPSVAPAVQAASSHSTQAQPQVQPKGQSQQQANTVDSTGGSAPIVDAMEQQAYGRVFASQTLDQRLSRLEERYLGTVQRGDYAARVDNLRWLVLGGTDGSTPTQSANAMPDEMLTPSGSQPYSAPPPGYPQWGNAQPGGLPPGTLASPQPGQPVGAGQYYDPTVAQSAVDPATMADMSTALTRLEGDVLKQTYTGQPMDERLERLEMAVFQQSAATSGLSHEERLQRLMAVSVANQDSRSIKRSGGIKSLWPLIPLVVLMLL